MMTNPFNEIFGLIQESGGDAQKAFYKLAEEKGVNPNDILAILK